MLFSQMHFRYGISLDIDFKHECKIFGYDLSNLDLIKYINLKGQITCRSFQQHRSQALSTNHQIHAGKNLELHQPFDI